MLPSSVYLKAGITSSADWIACKHIYFLTALEARSLGAGCWQSYFLLGPGQRSHLRRWELYYFVSYLFLENDWKEEGEISLGSRFHSLQQSLRHDGPSGFWRTWISFSSIKSVNLIFHCWAPQVLPLFHRRWFWNPSSSWNLDFVQLRKDHKYHALLVMFHIAITNVLPQQEDVVISGERAQIVLQSLHCSSHLHFAWVCVTTNHDSYRGMVK